MPDHPHSPDDQARHNVRLPSDIRQKAKKPAHYGLASLAIYEFIV